MNLETITDRLETVVGGAAAAAPVENKKPYGRRHHMSVPFEVRYQIRGGSSSTSFSIVTSTSGMRAP